MSAVRHNASTMMRARELHRAGFTPNKIPEILERELGVRPHRDSVRRWIDERYAEQERLRSSRINARRWAPTWTFRFPGRCGREYQEAFIRRLNDSNVPVSSIAKVCDVVFPDEGWTRSRIAYLLGRST